MRLTRRTFAQAAVAASFLPLTSSPAQAATHKVDIRSMKFKPADMTIAIGDKVTFVNGDQAPHTASAKDGSFDTGKLTEGRSATITFATAGTFAYFCKVHPMMKARITVA